MQYGIKAKSKRYFFVINFKSSKRLAPIIANMGETIIIYLKFPPVAGPNSRLFELKILCINKINNAGKTTAQCFNSFL